MPQAYYWRVKNKIARDCGAPVALACQYDTGWQDRAIDYRKGMVDEGQILRCNANGCRNLTSVFTRALPPTYNECSLGTLAAPLFGCKSLCGICTGTLVALFPGLPGHLRRIDVMVKAGLEKVQVGDSLFIFRRADTDEFFRSNSHKKG